MSFATFVPLLLALAIGFVPVWLLRHAGRRRAQDYLVGSQYTRPEVVRNSAIAYALRMGALGPLFAWGASGELWPAIIGSTFLGLGVYLIYIVRGPLLEFVDDALGCDRSFTIHEFIAQQHGNDPRVRVLAASLTVFALLGLLVGEALAVAAFLKPMLPQSPAAIYWFAFGSLLLVLLHAVLAGHSGVMHSAQLQLGMLYLGVFGSLALFLYLHVSALTPMPPHGTLAVVVVTACGAIILYYRRSRYVDTHAIHAAATYANPGRESSCVRVLSRLEKILNVCVSILLALTIVVAIMELYAAGMPTIVRDGVAALRAPARVPGVALVALCLLPLLYPIVDVTNWQRLAALRKDRSPEGERSDALRGVFRTYAVESALMGLVMCLLGAIAVIATETNGSADVMEAFVAKLVDDGNEVSAVALPLLLIAVFAIALSTMSALFSASLCTLRYDVVPALWPDLAPGEDAAKEAAATRRTLLAGACLGLAFVAAVCVADASLRIRFTSSTFVALLFAFGCAQLSFAPLLLGPIVGRMRGRTATVSPGWALVVVGGAAAAAVAAVIVYAATGAEAWLWAAVPACVGSGAALFAIARATSRHRA